VAPGSSVLLVGTHHDQIAKLRNYRTLSEQCQSTIYRRFIDTSQSEKLAYPKVLDSIEISSRTGYNVKQLCTMIYDLAGQFLSSGRQIAGEGDFMRSYAHPGGKDQTIFQQRIPAKYIYLEEALEQYRSSGQTSILNEKDYQ
jgi:hypothetical protein